LVTAQKNELFLDFRLGPQGDTDRSPLKCKCHWTIRDKVHCAFSHYHALAQYFKSNTQQSVIRLDGARSSWPKRCTLRRTSIPCTHQAKKEEAKGEKSPYFLFGSNIDKADGQWLGALGDEASTPFNGAEEAEGESLILQISVSHSM